MEDFFDRYEAFTVPYLDYFGVGNMTEEEIKYWGNYMVEVTPIKSEISSTGNAASIRTYLRDNITSQNAFSNDGVKCSIG